jgi:predicted TIM-barrel fold metal-dependent hydrolase
MPRMQTFRLCLLLLVAACFAVAQNDESKKPPVIDIHVHAMENYRDVGPVCPFPMQFLASDAKVENEYRLGWAHQDCSPALASSKNFDEYMKELVAEWQRLNVTAVVMGDPKTVKKWMEAAPGRVIPGTSFDGTGADTNFVPVEDLRKSFAQDGFKVMGEVGLQYQGISPSDPSLDKYFALAEELDIPIGIHMGTGGGGRANIALPKWRGSMGDPLLLEDVLARHPKLRVWIMHAGYPMIDNLLTLLQANSHVCVDVAGLIWSYPIKEVNRYIERIVDAGFGDRLMFGTDQMNWPKLMATSISVIQNADYLTPQQKRDILYNNAARFLRIEQKGQ